MPSKSILSSIQLVCKVGHKLGSFPFDWDSTENQLVLIKDSRRRRALSCFSLAYMVINTIFMSFRLFQLFKTSLISIVPPNLIVLNILNIFSWMTATIFWVNTIIYKEQFKCFANHLMRLEMLLMRKCWSQNFAKIHSVVVVGRRQ